jgi:hypothetical protein
LVIEVIPTYWQTRVICVPILLTLKNKFSKEHELAQLRQKHHKIKGKIISL